MYPPRSTAVRTGRRVGVTTHLVLAVDGAHYHASARDGATVFRDPEAAVEFAQELIDAGEVYVRVEVQGLDDEGMLIETVATLIAPGAD